MPAPPAVPVEGIGTRIQAVRKLCGFTLRELARRAHVAPAQISRVERGQRYSSPSVVAGIARALSVNVSVLYGQPYIQMLQRDRLDVLLTPIAAALDDWDVVPEETDPPPRPLPVLEADVRLLGARRQAGLQFELAEALPGLISEVNHATLVHDRQGRDRERAYWLQAELGRAAYVAARRLGFVDLARHALGRMSAAAPHSGDPRQVAIERWDLARLLGDAARHDKGYRLVPQALRDLEDDGATGTRAVRGALYLEASVLARRAGDGGAVTGLLDAAGELAACARSRVCGLARAERGFRDHARSPERASTSEKLSVLRRVRSAGRPRGSFPGLGGALALSGGIVRRCHGAVLRV
ncbi:helix-turn-helix domain-containing protein [Streptomyces marincola]|uniref:helix-turn-helix domain-containing protein n=1 Tax=Streptomyces marincola TaxID=2878388 RepID=UPI001CF19790|nr:helix-turn-helix transcriptional regulator [Streptomyces marincola]UCM88266.1 helix-turn-helix domain-containing protein [Streptomyces marincola]